LSAFDWSQGDLLEGLQRYEAGEFFAAHEAWERVWLQSHEPDKTFLQALIQVTAAFHHLGRSNRGGATTLLRAAREKFARYPESYGGVSVTVLGADILARLQLLEGDEWAVRLPVDRVRICILGRD
jgi:predicted metal-dependent hydrolase